MKPVGSTRHTSLDEDDDSIWLQDGADTGSTDDFAGSKVASAANTDSDKSIHASESLESSNAITARTNKQIRRVLTDWNNSEEQLAVATGDIILIWCGSETQHGWVYAEHLHDSSKASWLPLAVLEVLPDNQQFMLAASSMDAHHETQLAIHEGCVLKVTCSSRTPEGWIYVEEVHNKENGTERGHPPAKAGWVPTSCLEWME